MEKAARWYVYELRDPRDGEVFYVGKGTGHRMHQHEKDAANEAIHPSKKINRIRGIVSAGAEVQKRVLAQFWDEQAAYDHETDLIEEIGLANLTNILPGGQKAWERRQRARAESRRKEKPTIELHEQLSGPGTKELLSRFAEWFKAGGHKGKTFAFTAVDPRFKVNATLSSVVYNEFMPRMWRYIQDDARALSVFAERIRPFGVEVQHA
jgi:hypothetical protein